MLQSIRNFISPESTLTIPSLAEIKAEREKTKFTPDISRLEEYDWILLFVCDELKKDHPKHDLLGEEAQYVAPAYTQSLFHFWDPYDPTMSAIPLKVVDPKPGVMIKYFAPAAKIKGEIWAVRPSRFPELDTYKQNTVEFRRQKQMMIVPWRGVKWVKDHTLNPAFGSMEVFYRSEYQGASIYTTVEKIHLMQVQMYLGRRSFWEPQITAFHFQPVEVFQNTRRKWLPKYSYIRRPNPTKK